MINLAEERGNLRQYRRRIKELEVEYIKLVKLLGMSTENTYHRIVTELTRTDTLLSSYRRLVTKTKDELESLSYS
jgi:cell shape-determining protein MreC